MKHTLVTADQLLQHLRCLIHLDDSLALSTIIHLPQLTQLRLIFAALHCPAERDQSECFSSSSFSRCSNLDIECKHTHGGITVSFCSLLHPGWWLTSTVFGTKNRLKDCLTAGWFSHLLLTGTHLLFLTNYLYIFVPQTAHLSGW